MIPEGWRRSTIGLLGEVKAGRQRSPHFVDGEERPYLRVANVFDGYIETSDVLEMSFTDAEFERYRLTPGDILLNEGQSLNFVGRAAIYRGEPKNCAFQNTLIRFRAVGGVEPTFALQLFQYLQRSGVFSSIATQTTSIAHLGVSRFASLNVTVPPFGEQKKIAAILSSIDESIESTQAVVDQLQTVKKAMMAEFLTRGLPGRHTRFKQTEAGNVPHEWNAVTIGDLGELTGGNGFRPPDWSTSGLPIIRIQNLNGSTNFNYYAGHVEQGWIVEPGELLFAWAGSRGASFGPCIWPGPRGVLNQHIHRIAPGKFVRKIYLYYLLRVITEAVEKKAHGFKDTLVHLRKGELTGWPVALPSIQEQDEIVAVLGSLEERLTEEGKYISALQTMKQSLSVGLLSGEIRVTSDKAPL